MAFISDISRPWIPCAVLVLTQQQGLCLYLNDFGYFLGQHSHCGLFPSSQCIFLDPVQEFYGRAKVRPVFRTAQLDPYFLLILLLYMLRFGCFCLSEKPWSSGGIRSQENLVPCNGIIVGGGDAVTAKTLSTPSSSSPGALDGRHSGFWSDWWVFLSCQPLHLDSCLQCHAHHLLWVPGKAMSLALPFHPVVAWVAD